MNLWIRITIFLFIQELISMNTVLLTAYQQNYSLWIITGIFIVATLITTTIGFFLGKWVQRRFKDSKVVKYSEAKARDLERSLGPKGSRAALVILGIFNFNYINAFLASWLSLSYKEVLLYVLISDLWWFLIDLAVILGVKTFVDPQYALYVMGGVSLGLFLLFALCYRFVSKYLKARKQ